jgi:protein-disulfide isomerase
MHDQIFRSEDILTPENIGDKLDAFAKQTSGMDVRAFQQCMDNGLSVGLVLRDVKLANLNEVNGTPTLFVNGRRVQGAADSAKLREIIAKARNELATGKDAKEVKSTIQGSQ